MKKSIITFCLLACLALLAACGGAEESVATNDSSASPVSETSSQPAESAESSLTESSIPAEESSESSEISETSVGEPVQRELEELPDFDLSNLNIAQGWYNPVTIEFNTKEKLTAFLQKTEFNYSDRYFPDGLDYCATVLRNDGYYYLPQSDYYELSEDSYAFYPMGLYDDMMTVRIYKNPYREDDEGWHKRVLVGVARIPAEGSNFLEWYSEWCTSMNNIGMCSYYISRHTTHTMPVFRGFNMQKMTNPLYIDDVYYVGATGTWLSSYAMLDDTHYLYIEAYDIPAEELLAFMETITIEKVPLFEE